jgi:hypothetical protein
MRVFEAFTTTMTPKQYLVSDVSEERSKDRRAIVHNKYSSYSDNERSTLLWNVENELHGFTYRRE